MALGVSGGNIGKLLGGGIVAAEWNQSGVTKLLIASLTNLSTGLQWTLPAYQAISTFSSASASDGFGNTNGIIHRIYNDFGHGPTTEFIDNLQYIVNEH